MAVKWETKPQQAQPIEPMELDRDPQGFGCMRATVVVLLVEAAIALFVFWLIRGHRLW